MQRLSGLDGMFLSVDAAHTAHSVMGGLLVFDPGRDPEAGGRDQVIARILDRIDGIPPFRWRLTGSPVALNNRYWIETMHVDVPAHVREVHLTGAGDDRELAQMVASLHEARLDLSRPPWEYIVIRGLAGGRVAHLIRIHHAAVDGSTVPTILDLLSDRPTAPPEPKDAPGTLAGFVPGTPVATLRGVAGWVVLPARLAGTGLRTLRYLWGRRKDDGLLLALPSFVGRMLPGWAAPVVTRPVNALRRRSGRPEVLPLMPKGPMNPTPFNGRITSRRTYAFSDLPLADFKAAGKAFDASLNDAVVAVCAGAVRRFLVDHGAPTGRPLVVCIPATLRTGDEKQRWANHVSMFFAEFPTHLSDPAARIEALHSDLEQAKDNFDAGPTTMIRDVMGYLPETFWDVSVKLMAHGPDWIPGAPWNVVVSNVRGPAQTISMYGLELAGYWPVAFLTPGIGLNITLQSYRDRMDFGFIGCPDLTPDLWDFPTYMAQSLAELQAAAAARTGDVPSISPPRKAATRAPRPRPATSAGRVRGTSAARARPPTAAPAADG